MYILVSCGIEFESKREQENIRRENSSTYFKPHIGWYNPKANHRIYMPANNWLTFPYNKFKMLPLLLDSHLIESYDVCGSRKTPSSKLFCMRRPGHKGSYCVHYTMHKCYRWPITTQLTLFGNGTWWRATLGQEAELMSYPNPRKRKPYNFNRDNYWEYD